MNRKDIDQAVSTAVKTRKYADAIEAALEAAPEGANITGLLAARKEARELVEAAAEEQRKVTAAVEEARLANRKTVTLRRNSWDAEDKVEVELVEARHSYGDSWEVYLDGELIGRVGTYTGSLDRKSGRLRIPGKTRTLWSAQRPERAGSYSSPSWFGLTSRAEAIRDLLRGL